jgi:hypothetical protein
MRCGVRVAGQERVEGRGARAGDWHADATGIETMRRPGGRNAGGSTVLLELMIADPAMVTRPPCMWLRER